MKETEQTYDLAVIGGGPAGMMTAGIAAKNGLRVILLEKNKTLGKKLLLTGGGRCNLANAEPDKQKFLSKFKSGKDFLHSPFAKFGIQDTLNFFNKDLKTPTKVEAENRVFPESDSAQGVLDALIAYLNEGSVTILSNSLVKGFEREKGQITGIKLKDKDSIKAKAFVLATGGKSHPETGSTGDGFVWLKEMGHTINEPSSALVPIEIKEDWVKQLSGLSLQDIKLTAFLNGQKQNSGAGKMLFTHFGISGPLVLNMSKEIGELLKQGDVTLEIDLMPKTDIGELDQKLKNIFLENANKKIKNGLDKFIPSGLVPAILNLAEIDPEKNVNVISREERLKITNLIKKLPMTVEILMGLEHAIVASGGLDPHEINFKTMQSVKYPNLFIAGDIIDIDRPSGGYSLQLCWTMGFVAGESIAEYLR